MWSLASVGRAGPPRGVGGVGQEAPSSLGLRSVSHGGVGSDGGDGERDMLPLRYVGRGGS